MLRNWRIERRAAAVADGTWPEQMHPVLRRIYAARGVAAAAEVEHRLARLAPPQQLGGLEKASVLLAQALREGRRIVVVGDFDADGATGTAVAVRGLRLLGAGDVDYRVPNRFTHGYGLSPALVEELLPRRPDFILTVDNGVAAHAGVAAANAHGIAVIVTDHHLPGDSLPAAAALVNPNLPGDAFPSKALAGVGVVFYLLLALRAHLRGSGWFGAGRAEPDLSTLLDLVALGTVADLVPLDYNNRVLVDAGLRRIRARQACAGVLALIEASKRSVETVCASDLGFALGPRINAAGRMDDMRLGIECLLSDEPQRARELAERLSAMNAERRELQAQMVEQGEANVAQFLARYGSDTLPVGVVLYEPDWHVGVVGLVASKLKERLHRPVIACAPADEDGLEIKASGRSIAGFHLRDALAEVDARHPGLLTRFGGHAMAAGLSLPAARLAEFAAAFDAVTRRRLDTRLLDPVLQTDGCLAAQDYDLELARQLRYAGPWGQAFPEPLFDDEFRVLDWKRMGETHLRLTLQHAQRREPLEAVMFGGYAGTPPPARLRAAFELVIDDWNGRERLRLLLRHVEAL
ncbi:MAG: single-stranded-DNA-specific exonuclease RecJ [Lysobacterales bacterium 69-70]|nr:single-stranded-DNA-specific exonuclease RecJ [Xanthomonadaceae bacterium]ODU35032.1 MAG: single-stranded-DNA-specific exonuclease RecJ [Xanthomonadaceae bacterium SCN 69-320]ODV20297.1 MAG: single-stranded-DNA-specific exonuclease RecJ [Xanthomonadaceae bacterium SCN 69-25]OJY95289.1 MAG: single-stranded-DNA-specific exonuclease RecJ [Xanthomonadales bacterium 69-70]